MYPGMKIRELRTLENMSQEELGRRVGVQRAAIQKYEKGSVTNIPLSTIEKIAKVFNVSPTYIVGWEELDRNKLALETRVLKGLSWLYGEDSVRLLESYQSLTKVGKRKLRAYLDDLERLYGESDEM